MTNLNYARAALCDDCCRRPYTIFPRFRRSQADRLGSPTGGACLSTDSGRCISPEAYDACAGDTTVSVTNWARSAHMTCLTYFQTYARTAYTAFFARAPQGPTNHQSRAGCCPSSLSRGDCCFPCCARQWWLHVTRWRNENALHSGQSLNRTLPSESLPN